MAIAVHGFNNERLIQARNARGLTATSLADLVEVSPTTISLYEKGTQKPRQEVLDRLARVLNLPESYFLREVCITKPGRLFYRSMSAATKSARARAEARYEWTLELLDYLLEFFDFPEVRLFDFDIPRDFKKLDTLTIESVAEQLRAYWTLGDGPVSNMVRTLESNGIVVSRCAFEAETLDAFSEYRDPHPVVMLSSDKQNYFRGRFDAAHELGHLILHKDLDKKSLNKSSDFKIIEKQAHHFAAAFLLPATTYSNELWGVSLEAFRSLKPRWNASIALQIMRSRQLGLVNDDQEKRLWINLSRRGWRKNEPLDDSTMPEQPTLVAKSINMLLENKVSTSDQISQRLNLYPAELEKLAGIEPGEFSGRRPSVVRPTLKQSSNKILPFRR